MRILKFILIQLIIIASFCVLLEFAGRVYFYLKHGCTLKESFLYHNDDTLIYKINPIYKGVHGKHYRGMREAYFEEDKGDKVRIVCLGGSTTYGHAQFDRSKVWPEILECLLNQESDNLEYEVINAGVPGHGSSNLLARLEKKLLCLKPDLIIIYTGWNLAGSVKSKYAWVPDNIYYTKQPILKRLNNFLVDNSIWYIKMKEFLTARSKPERSTRMEEIINKIYKSELSILQDDLVQMIGLCKNNAIVPVIIRYPSRDYDYRRYADTIKLIEKTASQNDVHLIDCSHYFEFLDEDERAQYFVDIAHFSDKGHEKIAEIIYSALIERGLVN